MAITKIAEVGQGDLLGRYRVIDAISSGSTGAVYRAADERGGEEVAIKLMFETGNSARFEIESRLLFSLTHPRVVAILDSFEAGDGMCCIVMGLVHGTDLGRTLWDRGTPGLPVAEVIEWARQGCEALQYLHEQSIVHGDVKPQNLIIGTGGVTLVDFGAATRLDAHGTARAIAGTARFMPPEVFSGGAVSPRSDVFAMAATVWQLLTGAPPAYGEGASILERCPDASAGLADALSGALEIRPERRTVSAAALAEALGAPLREHQGASLAVSIRDDGVDRSMLEEVVLAAARVFDAAAASIALLDEASGELVYQAAWGAGAHEVVGMRLGDSVGIAGAVLASGVPQAVPDCRSDDRFAAEVARGTRYVPHTMLVVPMRRAGVPVGVLSILDRRDGDSYQSADIARAEPFADLVIAALRLSERA